MGYLGGLAVLSTFCNFRCLDVGWCLDSRLGCGDGDVDQWLSVRAAASIVRKKKPSAHHKMIMDIKCITLYQPHVSVKLFHPLASPAGKSESASSRSRRSSSCIGTC